VKASLEALQIHVRPFVYLWQTE